MKEPPIDPERLAAFLDGRVAEPERSAVVKQIASSDEAYDVLVDVSAVLPEVESTTLVHDAPAAKRRFRFARSKRVSVVVLAFAAMLVFAVAVKSWLNRGATNGDGPLVALATPTNGLDADFYRAPLWSATRGESAPIRSDARAVRLGVRLADVSLSVNAPTSSGSSALADIAELLDGIPGAAATAAQIRSMSATSDSSDAQARNAYADVVQFADRALVDAGFTLELSRAAARSRNSDFFTNARTARALARVADLPALRERAPNDIPALHALTRSAASADWAHVERTVSELIRALAS